MNRAMFSGVSGLKTHQTRMDVIGNNIANVNTYGYKSQRAIFSDLLYQTLQGASEGTTNSGGTNPSVVGYGVSLAGIQTLQTQSSMQSTGFGLDVAIVGEGYLQVMDPDGNVFYTKAGLLDYDSNGYLTDINGNFVLGATSADGEPGTQKIKIDNVGAVDSKSSSVTETVNGVTYTITASKATELGNIGIAIGSSEELPAGLKAVAEIASTGAIVVQLNAFEKFESMTELNNVINAAIREANDGKDHAAGPFTITADENLFGTDAVVGTFQGSAQADEAMLEANTGFFGDQLEITNFTPSTDVASSDQANVAFNVTFDATASTYSITATLNGVDYTLDSISGSTTYPITLNSATGGGSIELDFADGETLEIAELAGYVGTPQLANFTAPKHFLGGVKVTAVSADFPYAGVMDFTVSGLDAVTGAYNLAVEVNGKTYQPEAGAAVTPGSTVTLSTSDPLDGTITVSIPALADMQKNLGVDSTSPTYAADFEAALNTSSTWHDYKSVAAQSAMTLSLTGAQIAGSNFGVEKGYLEGDILDGFFGGNMFFMETSTDFDGSGLVAGNDLSATFTEDPNGNYWTINMNVGGKDYSTQIMDDTVAASILLQSADGDYMQMSNPGFDDLNTYFRSVNGVDATNGTSVSGLTGGAEFTVFPSVESRDLGFSTVTFGLKDGTEGGTITLDELTSVSIGSDGTITVAHPDKGTIIAGKISLANFSNPRGLELVGNNYYSATVNSGDPVLADPGSGGTGGLSSSTLEMSNVDLTNEFSDMIVTQRGYQANARIITVSDTMLEELINLKR